MFDQMIGSGEPLTEAALASAENEISRKIPGPFRAFLLKYNGGRPDAADFAMAARGGATQPGTIKSFFGIGMPERTFNLDYVLQTFGDRIPAWSFPIARDPGGNLIVVATSGKNQGKVYFWDHEGEAEEGQPPAEDNLYLIANSFDDFLAHLTKG